MGWPGRTGNSIYESRILRFARTEEGVKMFWQILAWAAVVLLMVFRVALVVGVIALVYMIVRTLRAPKQPMRHAGAPARK
jgi:hypothetical protein